MGKTMDGTVQEIQGDKAMSKRNGFKFYVIEACPKGYGEDEVRYYSDGKGYKWRNNPHEGTAYSVRSWAEKRVEAEKSGCQWIKILTYNAELQHEESA